jgi:predicted ATPase
MIRKLTFRNFKSFGEPPKPERLSSKPGGVAPPWLGAEIKLGGLSLIIGTNASGKSNIRDGLRFIHGISRGYSLSEIIGEKYVEGGVLQWKGIRGGVREAVTRNSNTNISTFEIGVEVDLLSGSSEKETAEYWIAVDVGSRERPPSVANESLRLSRSDRYSFSWNENSGLGQMGVHLRRLSAKKTLGPKYTFRNDRPALTQILELNANADPDVVPTVQEDCRDFLRSIASVRFLDLDPNSLRKPSIPGQTLLGDKGENLSSVLQAICTDPSSKTALIEWTRELTPLDIVDLEFPEVSLGGQIQLQIVESGGRKISAESASDGTLRFLAFAGALLGTDPARLYFFEEIENGIHPSRAHLLIDLLQSASKKSSTQIIGTTHSPALLNFLDRQSLLDASLVYRKGAVSLIRSFSEIPALQQVTGTGVRAGELHGSGWFENAAAFLEAEADG